MQKALEIDFNLPLSWLRFVGEMYCHYVSVLVGLANGRLDSHVVWTSFSQVLKPRVYLSKVMIGSEPFVFFPITLPIQYTLLLNITRSLPNAMSLTLNFIQ